MNMEWLVGVGATVGVFFVSTAVKTFLNMKALKSNPYQFMMDQGFSHARQLRRLLKPTMSETALVEMTKYLGEFPNYYDKGWDSGLTGAEQPDLEKDPIRP